MPHPPQPLASLQQIYASRSKRDGIPTQIEEDLRVMGCMLIQEVGILLELPQSTMATAQVLLHRFFYVSSMLSFSVNDTSMAALYLSTKLCETPIRLKELLNVYLAVIHRNRHLRGSHAFNVVVEDKSKQSQTGTMDIQKMLADFGYQPPPSHASIWWTMKDAICIAEMQILKRLGFNMQVDLPYSHIVNYCKILDLVAIPGVVQHCWGILNDALQTPIYTHHAPPTIACSSILLVSRLRQIPLPDNWWILFDADFEDMVACCGHITRLWTRWGDSTTTVSGVREVEEASSEDTGEEMDEMRGAQRERWSRTWKMASSRHYVRSWVQDQSLDGEHGWIDV